VSEPVWHPETAASIKRYLARPSHALLIVGAEGSGKYTLASVLTRNLLKLSIETDLLQHHAVKQPPEAPSIPIEFIRELRDFTKLRSTGAAGIARIILLPDAQRMQVASQNALLKLLEEPPSDTIILMTAPSERLLLPTIISRTQQLRLLPPSREAATQHFTTLGHKPDQIARQYMLSNGRMGLMTALLQDDASHPLAASVLLAKEIVQAPAFERLAKVEELSKDKPRIASLLEALEQVLRAAIAQTAKTDRTAVLVKLHDSLGKVVEAKEALRRNVLPKLVLTNLFLSM
jgi:DNA polymerase-3 subunit delta'